MVSYMSMLLFYFVIILFLYYTFRNKKSVKWNEVLNVITLNQLTRSNDDNLRIPGPIRLPIVGTKWTNLFGNMNKLHEYYDVLNRKYGDVVLEMAGKVPVISLYKKQDIDKVLKAPSKYPFRPPTEIISYYRQSRPDRYSSVGVVNAQGPEWAHLRSKLTPKTLESRKVLAAFIPDLNRVCDDFINVIKERRNGDMIVENAIDIMKSMAMESNFFLILGRRIGYLNETFEENKKFHDLAVALKTVFRSFRDAYYGNGLWKYFPTQTYKTYVENEELAYNIVREIVDETLNDEKAMSEDIETSSLLLTILKTEGLDIRDKISGAIDLLQASFEIFSHTVSFLLHYLTVYPEAQEKIFEETVNMDEVLTIEDLNRAYYTRAAIQEAFRLSPSAFAIARILEEDFYLSGYNLKAGTVVLCQNMIASSKNENFENASQYKPERWLNESGEFDKTQCPGSSIVLPFGCSKRICPGKKYSELQLMILVIKLVRSFKIKYHSEFERQFEFILAAKAPVNIQFCDRI